MSHRNEIVGGPSSLELPHALLDLEPTHHPVRFLVPQWLVAIKDTHIANFAPTTPLLLVSEIKRVCEDGREKLVIVGSSLPQPVIQRRIPFRALYSPQDHKGWIEFDDE